jgi:hypothetical protein
MVGPTPHEGQKFSARFWIFFEIHESLLPRHRSRRGRLAPRFVLACQVPSRFAQFPRSTPCFSPPRRRGVLGGAHPRRFAGCSLGGNPKSSAACTPPRLRRTAPPPPRRPTTARTSTSKQGPPRRRLDSPPGRRRPARLRGTRKTTRVRVGRGRRRGRDKIKGPLRALLNNNNILLLSSSPTAGTAPAP